MINFDSFFSVPIEKKELFPLKFHMGPSAIKISENSREETRSENPPTSISEALRCPRKTALKEISLFLKGINVYGMRGFLWDEEERPKPFH